MISEGQFFLGRGSGELLLDDGGGRHFVGRLSSCVGRGGDKDSRVVERGVTGELIVGLRIHLNIILFL